MIKGLRFWFGKLGRIFILKEEIVLDVFFFEGNLGKVGDSFLFNELFLKEKEKRKEVFLIFLVFF